MRNISAIIAFTVFFVLISTYPVFAVSCPEGSGGLCTALDDKILCGKIGPECAGGDYNYGGTIMKVAWICESDIGCTCYCPFIDKCGGRECPPPYCDGEFLQIDGRCSYGDGQCYYRNQWCKFGCDDLFSKCKEFVPELCVNTCASNEIQKSFPDCACEKMTCNPGYMLVADTCTPVCDALSCMDSCEESVYDTGYLFKKNCVNNVCVEEDPKTCVVGCKLDTTTFKGSCKEDCDNKVDDDGDGKVDCADPDCTTSLYCQCPKIGTHSGSAGGKTLNVLIGGYYYAATNESYNYRNRDEDTLTYANMIKDYMSKTDPIGMMNMNFYVTRFAPNDWVITRNDLLAKCKDATDGFTMFMNFFTKGDSFSYMNSMSATLYRSACDRMPGVIDTSYCGEEAVHEFGHGFGGLWDEYNVIEQGGFFPALGNTIDKAYLSTHTKNCAVVDNESDCRSYFDRFNVSYRCVPGCSNPTWYRSSDESVMHWDFASGEYNDVSKSLVKDKIDRFLNPDKYITRAVNQLTSVPLSPGGVRKPIIGPMPKQ